MSILASFAVYEAEFQVAAGMRSQIVPQRI